MKFYGVDLYLKTDDCIGVEKLGKVIVKTGFLCNPREICTGREIKIFNYDSFFIRFF